MTAPYIPGPSDPRPAQSPQPAKKKIPLGNKIALGFLAFVLLCCGGTTIVGLLIDTDKPAAEPTAAAVAAAPTSLPPTASPAASTTQPSPPATSTTPRRLRPTPKPSTKVAPRTTKPKPRPTRTTKPATATGVHPGAFCSPEGAYGRTSAGTLMRCTRKAGEKQARWRKA